LWHIPASEKVKFFLWSALHNALPTKAMLSHRGMPHSTLCSRCNLDDETTLYCLRDCEFVKSFWKSIGFVEQTFFQGNKLYEWLRNGINGPSVFLFLAAVLWIPLFKLRLCTENLPQLLLNCFLKNNMSPATNLVRWNAHGCIGMILNVDGSSIGVRNNINH
jgi:hypothetical protein